MFFSLHQSFAQRFLGDFRTITEITKVGDVIFFAADDGVNGLELWKSDGSPSGTVLVKDINKGIYSSSLSGLTEYKGLLYFSAFENINGQELWVSDGTADGTKILKNIRSNSLPRDKGSSPHNFFIFQDELFFRTTDGNGNSQIWKTDGSENNTVNIYGADFRITNLVVIDKYFLFVRGGNIVKFDVNGKRVEHLDIDEYYYSSSLRAFNNNLYFITYTSSPQKIRLNKLDPVSNETTILKEFEAPLYGSQELDNFIEVNSDVFFSVRTKFDNEPETDVLWKTNGTTEGTIPLKSFKWDKHLSGSFMSNFTNFNDRLYFRASKEEGYRLWKSDGSEAGTTEALAIPLDIDVLPITHDQKLYFSSSTRILWETDGTAEGSKPFPGLSLLSYTDPTILKSLNNSVYFKARHEQTLALWSTALEPNIKISYINTEINSGKSVQIKSAVDSVVSIQFILENIGKKELSISKIQVSGKDLFLDGQLPEFIQPNEETVLKLFFFPHKQDTSSAKISIFSTDLREAQFDINIEAIANGTRTSKEPITLNLSKTLTPNLQSTVLKLTNSTIDENEPKDTNIGTLSVSGISGDFTYSFIEGTGNRDNGFFTIENDQLKSNRPFDFEYNNHLNIRIAATSQDTTLQSTFIIEVSDQNENIDFDGCGQSYFNVLSKLNDAEYVDDNTIIIVGDNGKIAKSINNGDTWEPLTSGTTKNLLDIQFLGTDIGYIIGDGGLVLKSENGGKSWFPLASPESNYQYPFPKRLHFFSSLKGLLYGEDYTYATNDGGKTWKTQYVGASNSFNKISFINDTIGFMSGRNSRLAKTTNGGKTWETKKLSNLGFSILFTNIFFTTEKIGYLVGDGSAYKTEDSGETWSRVSIGTSSITGLIFTSETNGFAMSGDNKIYETSDGGLNWIEQGQFTGYPSNISFSPDKTKAIIVGLGTQYTSTDRAGHSIVTMKNNTWNQRSFIAFSDFYATEIIDSSKAFVFGKNNYRTLDGGLTWTPLDISNRSDIKSSIFVNENVGFIKGSNDSYKTIDGGMNWSKITSSTGEHIYFYDENFGFSYGWSSSVSRTNDGGNSWQEIKNVTSNSTAIEDMIFLNQTEGFAVSGNRASILKTLDGGLTWEELNSFYLEWLHTIAFANANIGVAAGNNGFMLRTEDGGKTWNQTTSGIDVAIRSINFVDELVGYAAAGNNPSSGYVFKTTDAGLTWNQIYNTSSELYDLSVLSNDGYIVGRYGVFFKSTNIEAPGLPGYIYGDTIVSTNSRMDYSVQPLEGTNYKWSVDTGNEIIYSDTDAQITWNTPGDHQLKVTSYNSCGEGETREITIKVIDAPNPEIKGEDHVAKESIGVEYQTDYYENRQYIWSVEGSTKYEANKNTISIDWSANDIGKIEVLETDISTGARSRAMLGVFIEDIVTSTELSEILRFTKLYPNPSSGQVNIELDERLGKNISIKVIDLSGKVFRTLTFDWARDAVLDLSSLPNGIYIFEFSSDTERVSKKVIKR